MHNQPKTEPWLIIEDRIIRLRLVERQIEDLRNLLALDWQIRMSLPPTGANSVAWEVASGHGG
jgi:hypothetical protein